MITRNTNICTGCGLCVSVCPFTVLEMGSDGVVHHTGKSCIACMHCAAICPNQALTWERETAIAGTVQELSTDCMAVTEQLICQRRSYRKFQNKQIPRALLERALSAAIMAPSAKNEHPTRWIVLENEEKQKRIMDEILQYCVRGQVSLEIPAEVARQNNPVMGIHATLLIGYCAEGAMNPEQDTAVALATAELLLQAAGVGTCWGGYLTRFFNQISSCRQILRLPENCNVYGTMMMGYPDQPPYRFIPKRIKQPEITWC